MLLLAFNHKCLLGFAGGSIVGAAVELAEVGAAEADDGATVCDGCIGCCDGEGAMIDDVTMVDAEVGAAVVGAGAGGPSVVLLWPEASVNATLVRRH